MVQATQEHSDTANHPVALCSAPMPDLLSKGTEPCLELVQSTALPELLAALSAKGGPGWDGMWFSIS